MSRKKYNLKNQLITFYMRARTKQEYNIIIGRDIFTLS